ncbi:MAG: hypothetical protein WCR97_00650 [Bacilli bacterium]
MKFLQKNSHVLITYLVICAILIGISCVGFIYNTWEVTVILGIGTFFDLFYLILVTKFGSSETSKYKLSDGKNLLIFTSLKILKEILDLGSCALLIFLVKNSYYEGNDLRYLYLFFVLVPHFVSVLLFYLSSKAQTDN